jgi:antitoxin component of MazEF toxin-antitoxin module
VRSQGNSLVIAIPMELCRELGIGNGTPLVIERAGPYLVARVLDLMAPATQEEIESLRPPIKGQRGDHIAPAGMARAWREFLKQWKSQRVNITGGETYGNKEA